MKGLGGLKKLGLRSGFNTPVRTPGFKSRIRLLYPQRVAKGDVWAGSW